jgi:nucleotide-binding universal stress UspA family protein
MLIPERPYVILAAIAFDDTGVVALSEAARSAQLRTDSELHLVHVMPAATRRPGAHELSALNERLAGAPEELQRRIDMLDIPQSIRIIAHLREGVPGECILKTAIELDADLVVVGTRGRRGMSKMVFGSVAEQVLHHAQCPVLVARPKEHPRASERVEAPCPDCVSARTNHDRAGAWCERHSHARMVMHVYTPSDGPAASIIR